MNRGNQLGIEASKVSLDGSARTVKAPAVATAADRGRVVARIDEASAPIQSVLRRSRTQACAAGRRLGKRGRRSGLFSEDELKELETRFADGVTAAQVVEAFTQRGIRLSEATFRKYVQQGMLPRSRRIGRKGKNRGSLGMYPSKTVRRVNAIKQLMADGYTIEEIQEQFLRYTDLIEGIEERLAELFALVEESLAEVPPSARDEREIDRALVTTRKAADELIQRVVDLTKKAGSPRGERYQNSGAAGSAEDLL